MRSKKMWCAMLCESMGSNYNQCLRLVNCEICSQFDESGDVFISRKKEKLKKPKYCWKECNGRKRPYVNESSSVSWCMHVF